MAATPSLSVKNKNGICCVFFLAIKKVRLDLSDSPEFDSWRWIDFFEPQEHVIFFKKQVYGQALKELEPFLHKKRHLRNVKRKRGYLR